MIKDDEVIAKKGLNVEDYFMTKEEISSFKEMFDNLPKAKL